MIIKTIRMMPFAGIKNRQLNFNDGLNIVLGPNESGKSTMVNALKSSLFVDTNLTPSKIKTFLNSYLPVDGGDTVNVVLEFLYNRENYILEKIWGATKLSKLVLSSGSVITSGDEIAERMQEILGLNQGTYENILIIRQSLLSDTIDALTNDGQASESIQEILRNISFNTDGVSVSRLKDLVSKKVEEYYSRWDRRLEKPEGMRDIDNKWLKGANQGIIKAYYEYREAEKSYKEALEYELKLDEVVIKISTYTTEVNCLEEYVNKYKQVFSDVEKRKTLEYKKVIINNEITQILEAIKTWPVVEHEIQKLNNEIAASKTALEKLKDEECRAEKYESQRSLREKFLRVSRIFEEYNSEKEKLSGLQKVSRQDIDELNNARRILDEYKAKFEALKLKVKMISKSNSKYHVGEGLDDIREINLDTGDSYEAYINGKFSLITDLFELNVYPGEDGNENIFKKFEWAKKNFDSILIKHSVRNENELNKKAEQYKNQFDKAKLLAENLKKELGSQTFPELESQFKSIENISSQTPLNEIVRRVSSEQIKLNGLERDLNEKNILVDNWIRKYQTLEKLFEIHIDTQSKLKELEEDLSNLFPVPDTYSSVDEFTKDFNTKSKLYEKKKEDLTTLRIQRAELEKYQPEFTTKELEIKVKETHEEFEKVKKEAESYLLIKEELDRILIEIDAETFTPLKSEILNLLKILTIDKYNDAVIDETIPTGIKLNGHSIPVDLLSAGTKDILALAVRLGMANFYLDGRDGFIVMDDPLVNLDPERQKAAVECIKKVAERKQVILLTCHPSHAKLFGIDTITLS